MAAAGASSTGPTVATLTTHPPTSHSVDFLAGGQWLGSKPQAAAASSSHHPGQPHAKQAASSSGSGSAPAIGVQLVRLLPAGLAAVTFNARPLAVLKAVHVRHDSPRAHPGWAIEAAEVFVHSPAWAPGQPPPWVYRASPLSAQAWPSPEVPYIRHLLTHEAAGFGEGVAQFFFPPVISTAAPGAPAPVPPAFDPLTPRELTCQQGGC